MTDSASVKSVVFETTSRCNLKCRYCYNIHKIPGGPNPRHADYQTAKRTLKHLFRIAPIKRITMSGGEPFLADRFLELVLYCRMQGKQVSIITNGTHDSLDDYRYLREIEVKTFEVPLHSASSNIHDVMVESPGTWSKVMATIDMLKDLEAKVVPVIVVTKFNYEGIEETLKLCHRLGLKQVMINRFNVGGQGIAHQAELSLREAQLSQVFATVSASAGRLGLRVTSNVCSPVCIIDPTQFPFIGFAVCSPEITRRPLTLDAFGDLRFCNHSPVVMGNIFKTSLHDIFSGTYARSWGETVPSLCRGCKHWTSCFGGCRAASEQLGGSVADTDPILKDRLART